MAEGSDVFSGEMWTRKIGPLPMWAWAGAVGGGLGYFMYTRRNSGTAAKDASVAGSSDTGFGTTSPGVGGQSATPAGGGTTTVPVTTTPLDNHAWSVKAQSILIAMGFDPVTVANALQAYLGGYDLTAQQQAIVSEAIRGAGPTPEPVSPALNPAPTPTPIVQPPPTPTPTPTPSRPYEPPQSGWNAGANVGKQGSNGVGIRWNDLAVKALSSNTKYNPYNVNKMADEMRKANPAVAKEFPVAVPLYRVQTFIVPRVVGLNA